VAPRLVTRPTAQSRPTRRCARGVGDVRRILERGMLASHARDHNRGSRHARRLRAGRSSADGAWEGPRPSIHATRRRTVSDERARCGRRAPRAWSAQLRSRRGAARRAGRRSRPRACSRYASEETVCGSVSARGPSSSSSRATSGACMRCSRRRATRFSSQARPCSRLQSRHTAAPCRIGRQASRVRTSGRPSSTALRRSWRVGPPEGPTRHGRRRRSTARGQVGERPARRARR
jgi:hypothetical protein